MYMWHLRSIFVSGTYLTIMCEVAVVVGCIMVVMGKYVGFMCLFNIMGVWLIFVMWQPYLFIMCVEASFETQFKEKYTNIPAQ